MPGIAASLIFIILFNVSAYAYQCDRIRTKTIRLHIIAESDNEEDQHIKLEIRDAILKTTPEIFDGTVNTENAHILINKKTELITETANNILKKHNKSYTAKTELITEYFDTRIYDNNIIMPAGKYLALKVTIGKGKGANWWCIMFPPLCIPVVESIINDENIYNDDEIKVIKNNSDYEIRLKLIEYIEKIKNKVDNKFIR